MGKNGNRNRNFDCRLAHDLEPAQKQTKAMKRILQALSQESTWRGLIAISAACGIQAKPELSEAIITVALALIGAINVAKNK